MRHVSLIVLFAAVASLVPSAAGAEGPFGLGIILGEPTGISAKAWMGSETAIDAAAAWSFTGDPSFHIHLDYLVHFFSRLDVDRGTLPLYVGIGGRVKFKDNADDLIGVRIPLGASYLFADAPIDIFLEVVPLMDLAPKTKFRLNAAIGFRYFFGSK